MFVSGALESNISFYLLLPIFIIVGGILIYIGNKQIQRARTLVFYTKLPSLQGLPYAVPVAVEGKMLSHEEPLTSPLSLTKCLYYSLNVKEGLKTKYNNGQYSQTRDLGTIHKKQTCYLTDEINRVDIDLTDATLQTPTRKVTRVNSLSILNQNANFMGIESTNNNETSFLDFLSRLPNRHGEYTITESLIPVNSKVFVYGECSLVNNIKTFVASKTHPLIISNLPREKVIKEYRRKGYIAYFFGFTIIGVFLFVIIMTMIS